MAVISDFVNKEAGIPQLIRLTELQKSYALRCNEDFFYFDKINLPSFFKTFGTNFVPLNNGIKSIRNGKDVSKEGYSLAESEYIYLTVNNIKKEGFSFKDIIYLTEEVGQELKKHRLKNGNLIITRSGTVGMCRLFNLNNDKVYLPSGYVMVLEVDENKYKPQFLEYYLSTDFSKRFFDVQSSGKTQKNIAQPDVLKIPIPEIDIKQQEYIVERINRDIQSKIATLKEKTPTLQEIIDRVFIRHKIKNNYIASTVESFISSFDIIGEKKYLRAGARYHALWEVHKGLLFDDGNPKHPIYKLGDIIALHRTEILKKGALPKEYILIDLEDLEPLTGRIVNEEKIVDEIGSDKVVFGDCDIVTGKLRPYLGYTIINDKDKPYIGTTELLPFKIKDYSKALAQYIQYLLLSQEYISKSEFLMSGKEHPRIHPSDLLNMKIPIPDIKIQEKVVEEIKAEESKSFEHRQEIKRLRSQIDEVIYEAIKG